ncbi:hypothetical protein DVJ77_02920 [Dyella tabacisoli]|uniref:MarR family transcriptional regulator n=1 Tax=Dyella tabacisoli TaxID=2282381 RepID=A0A369US05_9GAMM|nr:hypothetical protein DVJ77_02920 [Dyella tabacisoli]
MDFVEFKELVFEAIAQNDGRWTWYQLDRRLMGANPEMTTSLMPAINELIRDRRIRVMPDSPIPGQPRYEVVPTNS